MKFEIYHQLGHQYVWNLQSLENDRTGDGVIISPKHIEYNKAQALVEDLKKRSFFDPQFFLPSYAKKNLASYDFFPQIISEGFETQKYTPEIAGESANKSIAFQGNNDFRYFVIPTRYMEGMPENYIDMQEKLFVTPFLSAIEQSPVKKPVLLQLVLNDHMIKNPAFSATILDWVTGIPAVNGVYLVTEIVRNSKQIKDIDFLYALMHFINSLSQLNQMDVAAGYLNVEGILLSLASPKIITIGSYENTRMFAIKNFEQDEEDRYVPQPTPRIYSPRLMQLVDHNYLASIEAAGQDINDLFPKNQYQATMFEESYKWHFTKPELYKHYFLVLSKQLREISQTEGIDRYKYVVDMFNRGRAAYGQMEEIVFDKDSDGSHLDAWQTAANRFARDLGWR